MYVELLGLPASGKSTIYKASGSLIVVNGKRVAGLNDMDQADTSGVSIPGYVTRRAASRAVYRSEQFRVLYPEFTSQISDLYQREFVSLSLMMVSAARYLAYQDHREKFDFFLVDEGLVHRGVHSLNRLTDGQQQKTELFLKHLPPIDFLIFLEIDPALCFQRVTERLAKRAGEDVTSPNVLRRIRKAHGSLELFSQRYELMKHACDHLEQSGTNVARLDVSQDFDTNSSQIMEHLSRAFKLP